jgi:hypothetical protein
MDWMRVVLAKGWAAENLEFDDMMLDVFMIILLHVEMDVRQHALTAPLRVIFIHIRLQLMERIS